MIGRSGKRGSGISMLAARPDDDDDDKFSILKSLVVQSKAFVLLPNSFFLL